MPGGSDNVDLGELLLLTRDLTRGSINGKLPATVVGQNSDLTITARPSVSGRVHNPDTDEWEIVRLPDIPNVPVAYPAGGGFRITWPLVAGDHVWLVISDRSLDEWKSGAPLPTEPVAARRFDLTDAVAIPATSAPREAVPVSGFNSGALTIEGDDIRLGSTNAELVALASKCDARFNAIETFLEFHTHTGVTSGAGVSGPFNALTGEPPSGDSVAAAKVKAE